MSDDITIIREPTVHLVGRQHIDYLGLANFLDGHSAMHWCPDTEIASDALPEIAGRLCYMSYTKPRPGGNKAYLNHILEVGHGSVLEHAVWNFIFTGVSRSLTHELVRHRAGFGFSQLSQRYVDESVAEYVCPHELLGDKEEYEELERKFGVGRVVPMCDGRDSIYRYHAWITAIKGAHAAYVKLAEKLTAKLDVCPGCKGTGEVLFIGSNTPYPCGECKARGKHPNRTELRKQARQAARSVLPNATETKIFVTMNARSARHFIEMRGSRHADVEIRKLAVAVLRLMQKESPNLFGDYQLVGLADGTFEAVTKYRKV